MKRQDSSLLSSSSRRQSSPEKLHSHTIGCMSGLFHLLSKYQKRRKFLTFGNKKSEKGSVVTSPSPKKGAKSSAKSGGCLDHGDEKKERTADQFRRLSCDVPRSPTLPAEIRRSNSVDSPGNYYRRPPALVARLMGLGESYGAAPESTAEKRRKLLGALERCDRDLKALKKIIESVQTRNTPPRDGGEGGGECEKESAAEARVTNGEQPSPVSVLDELTRSPLCSYTRRLHATGVGAAGGIVKQQQQQKKRPGEEEDIISLNLLERIATGSFQTRSCEEGGAPLLSRRAMVESVNEACRDVAWGEKRELGRIGVALQDLICRDLVDEFVKDMSPCRRPNNSLPFEACKRKLRF